MTTDGKESIIELIQKLLNLNTTNGASEAEASNALEKAQALLFKHNLSMSEVKGFNNGSTTHAILEGFIYLGDKRTMQWRYSLASCIAKYNFCKSLRSTGYIYFIGRDTDVKVVSNMFNYVSEQIEFLANKATKMYKRGGGRQFATTYRNSYIWGVISNISSHLKTQWDKMAQQSCTSTALVVKTDEMIQNWIDEKYPQLRTVSHKPRVNMTAYQLGKQDGDKINVSVRPEKLGTQYAIKGGM